MLSAVLTAGVYAYLQHPKFGALPDGARLQRIERSPHYVKGTFQNLIETPMRTQDTSLASNVMSMMVDRNPNLRASAALVSTRVDLKPLPLEERRDADHARTLGHLLPAPRHLLTPNLGALVRLDASDEARRFGRWWESVATHATRP